MTTPMKTYERHINEILLAYLAGTVKFPDAVRRLRQYHLSTTQAQELLCKAVDEAAEGER